MKNAILLIILLCVASYSSEQIVSHEVTDVIKDTVVVSEKNYLTPLVETIGTNLVIGGFSRYVLKLKFAYINQETILHNCDTGFVWDDDEFEINQIGHPYQGGLYYSAAKYFGHGYFVGTLYSMLGSLQWEYFMENEPPSINDLITTSLSGPMLGEILYRLSEKVLDDKSTGAERFFRESAALIINPVIGFNRLVSGASFSKCQTKRKTYVDTPVRLTFNAGGQLSRKADKTESTAPDIATGDIIVSLIYGDLYSVKRPFDFFMLDIGINTATPMSDIKVQGVLWNKELTYLLKKTLFNIYHNYDFVTSGIYKVGAASAGIGLSAIYPFGDNGWGLLYSLQINGIFMGGASTEYYFRDARDYNLGPGAGVKIVAGIGNDKYLHVKLKTDRYYIHTFSGADGNELIGVGTFEAGRSIWKGLGVSIAYNFFDRFGYYRKYNENLNDISEHSHEFKAYLTYSIK
jgi:hypothetical protein